jgi:hypothetical protein
LAGGREKRGSASLPRGPACQDDLANRYTAFFLALIGTMLTGGAGKRVAMGGGVDEAELDDGVAEKIAGLLLLLLVPADSREVAGNAGKKRRSGAPACSGELSRGH